MQGVESFFVHYLILSLLTGSSAFFVPASFTTTNIFMRISTTNSSPTSVVSSRHGNGAEHFKSHASPVPPTSRCLMNTCLESRCNDVDNNEIAQNPRSCILQVGVSAGRLCGVANSHLSMRSGEGFSFPTHTRTVLVSAMSDLLLDLFRTSQSLQLNLIHCIHNKLELNNKKYPVELCKVRGSTGYPHG